ncbi:DUF4126 family protein [Polymorphobacter fuscus]|uniref:DUF4126 domain-containing protein n=1 Tax=Sandarakinorhabdus fusca TaxID=1439888 RepID=A0A7C9KH92_9SPHN|nr:DUF4126 family protein [Polymorphobacter fuscus]KAB7647431.1 DUF4126 domain-containing protein [Polymorphobacter fuscus]MQT16680.1 DUF4126 domain-containing protein [Polymorphobacter fuscus]NJC09335.1 putative membrane protein [Polymorphobacter fuscus]
MRDAILMGLVGGQRAMTPLAMVSVAAARGELSADNSALPILSRPIVAAGALALAVLEMAGDKQKTAPDRIVAIGLTARFITNAVAGAALSTRRDRWLGAAVGGLTAVVASYPGWRARMAAIPVYGQSATGFVEDAAVVASAAAIVRGQQQGAQA